MEKTVLQSHCSSNSQPRQEKYTQIITDNRQKIQILYYEPHEPLKYKDGNEYHKSLHDRIDCDGCYGYCGRCRYSLLQDSLRDNDQYRFPSINRSSSFTQSEDEYYF